MLTFLTFKPFVYNVDILTFMSLVYNVDNISLVFDLLTMCVHDEGCSLLLFGFFYIEI